MTGSVSALPTFALHLAAWIGVLGLTAGYAALIRIPRHAVTRRQAWCFLGAMGIMVVACTWPLANLAAHRLLLALILQRLLLMLAVPPLVLAGVPRSLVVALTRPAALDGAARTLSRPVPAVVVVTAVAIGTLSVPAVDAQASSALARGGFDALLVMAGLVLWLPVLQPVPGTGRMSALGQAAYLVVQSIVPSFLSIVWIFAHHPLYSAYAANRKVFGISPLLDQQLSGFLAKLATIFVLWTIAFVIVLRSERIAERGGDPETLTWADVERELERVARRERRHPGAPRERGTGVWRANPPSAGGVAGPGDGPRDGSRSDRPPGGEDPGGNAAT